MPALTRRRKRELPRDLEEDEDGPGNEMLVGILAQRARRREAAQEREREEQQTGDQVRGVVLSCFFFGLQLMILPNIPGPPGGQPR